MNYWDKFHFLLKHPQRRNVLWVHEKKKDNSSAVSFCSQQIILVLSLSCSLVAALVKHAKTWTDHRKRTSAAFSLTNPSQQGNTSWFNCCWHCFDLAASDAVERHRIIDISKQTICRQQLSVFCMLRPLGVVSTMTALQTERRWNQKALAHNSNRRSLFHIAPWSLPFFFAFCK